MTNDKPLLEAFLQEVLPKIEELVTRALQSGHTVHELAVVLERAFDGKVSGGCTSRETVVRRFNDDTNIPRDEKDRIAKLVRETPHDEIPVVLMIAREGYIAFGVHRLEGDVVASHKPN